MKIKLEIFFSIVILLHGILAYDISSHVKYENKKEVEDTDEEPDVEAPVLIKLTVEGCTIQVVWTCTDECKDSLTGFNVYWKLTSEDETNNQTMGTKNHLYLIPYLLSNNDYTVWVSSIKGEIEHDSEPDSRTTEEGVPLEVEGLTITDYSDVTVDIKWDPSTNTCPIKGYAVKWEGIALWNSERTDHGERTVSDSVTSLTIDYLLPYTNYTFNVNEVTSDDIIGNASSTQITTKEGEAESPLDISSSVISSSRIKVSWSPPQDLNGQISAYHISCKLLPEPEDECDILTTNEEVTSYSLTDLLACGNYTIEVQAKNGAGLGKPAEVTNRTNHEEPPSFTGINCDEDSTTANITWDKLATNCPVLEYTIAGKGKARWSDSTGSFSDLFYNEFYYAEDLIPYADYTFNLTATTEGGTTTSAGNKCRTKQGQAGAPENFNASTVDKSTVELYWSPPTELNGVVSEYQIKCFLSSNLIPTCNIETEDLTLQVQGLEACGDYTFKVFAINGYGKGQSASTNSTTDSEAPTNVMDYTVQNEGSTYIVVDFTPPETHCPVTYIVEGEGDVLWREDPHEVDTILNCEDEFCTIDNLIPYTNYIFNITATTDGGKSRPYTLPANTLKDKPSQPTNLQADNVATDSITLKWSEPEYINDNSSLLVYNVSYKLEGIIIEDAIYDITYEKMYTINNLKSCLNYSISVTANNSVGEGDPAPLNVETSPEIPPEPTNLLCKAQDSFSIEISWQYPETYCRIVNYTATLNGIVNWDSSISQTTKIFSSINSYTLYDLTADTTYTIKLEAATSAGSSPKSKSCTTTTPEAVPGKPTELKINDKSKSTITATWKAPDMRNGVLEKFYVYKNDEKIDELDAKEDKDLIYSYELQNLDDGIDYKISVRATNSKGLGEAENINSEIDESHLGAFLGTAIPIIVILIAVIVGVWFNHRSIKKKNQIKPDN